MVNIILMNGIQNWSKVEDEPIILICRTGRRTKIIAEMMDRVRLYNQKCIISWIDAKLPTAKLY